MRHAGQDTPTAGCQHNEHQELRVEGGGNESGRWGWKVGKECE